MFSEIQFPLKEIHFENFNTIRDSCPSFGVSPVKWDKLWGDVKWRDYASARDRNMNEKDVRHLCSQSKAQFGYAEVWGNIKIFSTNLHDLHESRSCRPQGGPVRGRPPDPPWPALLLLGSLSITTKTILFLQCRPNSDAQHRLMLARKART